MLARRPADTSNSFDNLNPNDSNRVNVNLHASSNHTQGRDRCKCYQGRSPRCVQYAGTMREPWRRTMREPRVRRKDTHCKHD